MNEALINKIRKLIAHEESARKIGSLEEAATFAEKINSLLIEHKLSMSEVEAAEQAETQRVGQETHYTTADRIEFRSRVDRWYVTLFSVVAKAHFCESISITGYNMISLIGREEDRAVAVAMFRFLLGAMKRAASQERLALKTKRRSLRNFRSSFYRGFIGIVHWRYAELRRNKTEGAALVLSRSDDEVQSAASKFHPNRENRAPRKLKNRVNRAARDLGVNHGAAVSLAGNVIDGATERGLLDE